jgi:hypothetical protein
MREEYVRQVRLRELSAEQTAAFRTSRAGPPLEPVVVP